MKYEDILKENTEILRGFEAQGTDLSRKYEICFDLELESLDLVKKAGALLRTKRDLYPSRDAVIVRINDPKNYRLHVGLDKQLATAEAISKTELVLLEIGHELGEHEVFWEFEVPACK